MTILKTRSGKVLNVRRLQSGDRESLQRFHGGLSSVSRSTFTPHAYDPETIDRYIRRSESDEDRIYVLLTESGEEIAGYFFLWEFQTPIPSLGIGIADAWQGQGLGGRMMSILIDDAKESGRDGIELTTLPENDRAFQLYRKMGFEYLGDVENVAGDGRVVTERKMFLSLKPDARPSEREFKPPV